MGIMNLSEIMDRSIGVLKKYFKSFFIYSLILGVLMIIAMVVAVIVAAIPLVFAIKASNAVFIGVIVAVIAVLVVIISFLPSLGIIKIAQQEFSEEEIYAGDAVKITFKKLFPAAGMIIIEMILTLPFIALFAGASYGIYKAVEATVIADNWYSITAILIVIAIVLLILLLIFFVIAYISLFAFSFQCLLIENIGIFKCIGKSLKLIRGDFWRIFGAVLLFFIVMYALNTAIGAFVGILIAAVYGIMRFLSIRQDFFMFLTVTMTYLRWPISIVSNMVIAPLFTIMLTMMYYNQRFKKEGYNLMLKLDKIESSEGEEEAGDKL